MMFFRILGELIGGWLKKHEVLKHLEYLVLIVLFGIGISFSLYGIVTGLIWVHDHTCIPAGWIVLGTVLSLIVGFLVNWVGDNAEDWWETFKGNWKGARSATENRLYWGTQIKARGFAQVKKSYVKKPFRLVIDDYQRASFKAELFGINEDSDRIIAVTHWRVYDVKDKEDTMRFLDAMADPNMFPLCIGIKFAEKFTERFLKGDNNVLR